MDKIIEIDGKKVGFRATALTPRLYRHKVGRDVVRDLNQLKNSYNRVKHLPRNASKAEKEDAQLSVLDLEIFENIAFVMAKQYDSSVPDTTEEWLEKFSIFSIYEILPHILELWQLNQKTTSRKKKK